jgi:hypothetical protein
MKKMKPKKRFSVVKVEDAKWMVRDAHTGAYVWDQESRTREEARRIARLQNNHERLRTVVVVKMGGEPLSEYLARQKKGAVRK